MKQTLYIISVITLLLGGCKHPQEIIFEGKVKRETISIAPKYAGRVEFINIHEGYKVQAGDTLEGLSQSYFGSPRLWHQLQARNKVKDPRQLQPGSVVWIPVGLLPAESAQVEFVHGDVKVHGAEQGATTNTSAAANPPVAAGTMLAEGTRLQVGPEGFVTVRLADGSVVKVSAQLVALNRGKGHYAVA